jgi:hypothetical protein
MRNSREEAQKGMEAEEGVSVQQCFGVAVAPKCAESEIGDGQETGISVLQFFGGAVCRWEAYGRRRAADGRRTEMQSQSSVSVGRRSDLSRRIG